MDINNNGRRYRVFIEIGVMLVAVSIAWASLTGKVSSQDAFLTRTVTRLELVEQNGIKTEKRLERLDARQELMLEMLREIKEKVN